MSAVRHSLPLLGTECATVSALLHKYADALENYEDAKDAYEGITSANAPHKVAAWEALDRECQKNRWDKPEVMDVHDIKEGKGVYLGITALPASQLQDDLQRPPRLIYRLRWPNMRMTLISVGVLLAGLPRGSRFRSCSMIHNPMYLVFDHCLST